MSDDSTSAFDRYIGIDYSGAQTPTSSLKGLRVYMADQASPPVEVPPPPSPRKYWTRRGIAEWLVEQLREDRPTLVGMDHGFSFPLRYFEAHLLLPDWPTFLDDFQQHWPTDGDHIYVDFVRDGLLGNAPARSGHPRWKRLTEIRAGKAKSVFQFDVQGSVAKSTHAGLPWLRYLRQQVGNRVHFWPFDGWEIPPGQSAVAEVYPSLWRHSFTREGRDAHQHDAYAGECHQLGVTQVPATGSHLYSLPLILCLFSVGLFTPKQERSSENRSDPLSLTLAIESCFL